MLHLTLLTFMELAEDGEKFGGTAKARQDFSQSIAGCSQFLSVHSKGEKSVCSNYQGITLLSIAGKILARVLLNRLIPTIAQEISRKPVWIQVEQSHRRHNFRAEADTREMQRTEHGSICSFRRPDRGL